MAMSGESSDGVRLALMSNRLDGIVRKMANTLLRTGRSGVLNMARDFSCCIVTADCALLGMIVEHRARHHVGSREHVDRQALGRGEQRAVGGDDTAGKIARGIEHARAAGTQQRVRHLAHDALEPVVEQREADAVEIGG